LEVTPETKRADVYASSSKYMTRSKYDILFRTCEVQIFGDENKSN
jgi:hypothetical protein